LKFASGSDKDKELAKLESKLEKANKKLVLKEYQQKPKSDGNTGTMFIVNSCIYVSVYST